MAAGPPREPPPPPPEDEWVYDRVSVEGVPIKVTNQGVKVDEDAFVDRTLFKIRSQVSSFIVGLAFSALFFFVLVCGVGGLAVYTTGMTVWKVSETMSAGTLPASVQWDGSAPLSCGGNDVVEASDLTVSLPDTTAVVAAGNCVVTLSGVSITAKVGIDARGNSKVVLHGGHVEGTEHAAVAGANASVLFDGTEVSGTTKTTASGAIQRTGS